MKPHVSKSNNLLPLQLYRKVLQRVLYRECRPYKWSALVSRFVETSDWASLYGWADTVDADASSSAHEFYCVSQLVALVKKYPHDLGFDARDNAKRKFLQAEKDCMKTNRRFESMRIPPDILDYLETARIFMSELLGDEPNFSDIWSRCDFGPGANIGVHGDRTNLFRKLFSEKLTVTPGAYHYGFAALVSNDQLVIANLFEDRNGVSCFDAEHAFGEYQKRASVVGYNKISFVPKTTKVHRTIAVEPLLNSFVQKGIDSFLRARLRAFGYDLSSQERNQHFAYLGSMTGRYATLDLASASDSISTEFVRYLLPQNWFTFLDAVRSKSFMLDDSIVKYEKFVSMGNGFCFPLETALFASLIRAVIYRHYGCCSLKHCVYGDDLIVDTSLFLELKRLLRWCGFRLNVDKSFHTGPFRESCGCDWYNGLDVRPVTLDYHLSDPSKMMVFHNVTLQNEFALSFFESVRPLLRESVRPQERLVRPDLYPIKRKRYSEDTPDGVLIRNQDGAFTVPIDVFMASRFARWNRDEQRWSWREFKFTPYSDSADSEKFLRAQFLAFLRGSPRGELYRRRKTRRSVIVR